MLYLHTVVTQVEAIAASLWNGEAERAIAALLSGGGGSRREDMLKRTLPGPVAGSGGSTRLPSPAAFHNTWGAAGQKRELTAPGPGRKL